MTKIFTYQGQQYEYAIVKSRGKRIRIHIGETGDIQLRIPARVSVAEAEQFLLQQKRWIVQSRDKILRSLGTERHTFEEGDVFYFRGNPYRLRIQNQAMGNTIHVEKIGAEFVVKGQEPTKEQIKAGLEKWYITNARVRFAMRCAHYAPLLCVSYQSIRIKNQKSRWGSCSSKRNLNFNWRLIMAEDAILDYVVVHELCHLREMNHSTAFWQLVESILPDYRERERWITEQGDKMLNW